MDQLQGWGWTLVIGALIGIPVSIFSNLATPLAGRGLRAILVLSSASRTESMAWKVAELEGWSSEPMRAVMIAIYRAMMAIMSTIILLGTLVLLQLDTSRLSVVDEWAGKLLVAALGFIAVYGLVDVFRLRLLVARPEFYARRIDSTARNRPGYKQALANARMYHGVTKYLVG